MSFCLDIYLQESEDYEVLLTKASFKEAKDLIVDHSPEVVYVDAGEKILGVRIIGLPPIPIGIDENGLKVTLSYTKPCYGTAVIELPVNKGDINDIKSLAIKT